MVDIIKHIMLQTKKIIEEHLKGLDECKHRERHEAAEEGEDCECEVVWGHSLTQLSLLHNHRL